MSLLAKRKHFYDIKKSATNYVNAIAKYGKKVSIDVIDGTPVDGGNLNCDNIQGVLERSQKENFLIECSSSYSGSTLGTFPLLDAEKLLSEVPREMIETPSEIIETSKKLISDQLDELKGEAYEMRMYEDPDHLTQQEATFLLTQLQYEGELIPSRNSGFQCYRDTASFDPSRNIHSFWQMTSPGAVLAGAGMVALAVTACVSYINRVR